MNGRLTGLVFTVVLLLLSTPPSQGASTDKLTEERLKVNGRQRTYNLFVPSSYRHKKKVPLVISLHGAGGSGKVMLRVTGWAEVAEKEGVIVAYPDATLDKNWNDGRQAWLHRSHREKVDDVAFIRQLIDHLVLNYSIDSRRIYISGVSNGAMFAQRLGAELSHRITAVASVIGNLPQPVAKKSRPTRPVPLLMINGTKDPIVPWKGGEISVAFLKFGKILSVPATIRYWIKHNHCSGKKIVTWLPDRDPRDGTRVKKEVYPGGKKGAEVVLYTVVGGGHTWPGGPQYLPEAVIGKINRDQQTTQLIWKFFQRHRR